MSFPRVDTITFTLFLEASSKLGIRFEIPSDPVVIPKSIVSLIRGKGFWSKALAGGLRQSGAVSLRLIGDSG